MKVIKLSESAPKRLPHPSIFDLHVPGASTELRKLVLLYFPTQIRGTYFAEDLISQKLT